MSAPSSTALATRMRKAARRLRDRLSRPSDGLKWYFAANESGSEGPGGLHARLAVLSALQNTQLRPHLVTSGFRNEFTDWMERRGVRVLDASQPLKPAIEEADRAGRYSRAYLGHWLRCEIPALEREDEFVLYTDYDVVFLRPPALRAVRPACFACAPEFRVDGWNYVNTGVMLMNVPALREGLPGFLGHVEAEIGKVSGVYHDQFAYNVFYRGAWDRLDPVLNWKPYWGPLDRAAILHFHGAKLQALRMIMDGGVPYDDPYWRMAGSLAASFQPLYVAAIKATLAATSAGDLPERPWLERLARDLEGAPVPVPAEAISLDFLDFRFFDDGP